MRKCTDIYGEPEIIVHANGNISRVYRPILTDEERARRMKRIEHAAIALLKDQMRAHKHIKALKND